MQSTDTPFITNQEIARVLFQTGALLELLECNPFRVRAYRRAALNILYLGKPFAEYVTTESAPELPGIGEGMRRKLLDLVNTGHMETHDVLVEEIGEPLASLLHVEGVGPRTALRLVSELQISNLQELDEAAAAGRIQTLRGFGPKREARIGEAVRAHLSGIAA
jgi:DNA polymerase (family 10)